MKIERLYCIEYRQKLEQYRQKEQERLARMTPEEAEAENARWAAAREAFWAKDEYKRDVFSPGRDKKFRKVLEIADGLARHLHLDLIADIPDTGPASIILRGFIIPIEKDSPPALKEAFLSIQTAADDIFLSGDDNLAQLELSYERYDYV